MSPVLVLLALLAGSHAAATTGAEAAPVVVLLVRHAEALPEAGDVGLSEAGHARARCLASRLAVEKPTHLFASPFRRAQETLAPAAELTGRPVATRDPLPAGALAAELRDLPPGSVAVVAGHTNTLPLLAQALGVQLEGLVEEQGQPAIPRTEHDRLVRVELPPGGAAPRVDQGRFRCP